MSEKHTTQYKQAQATRRHAWQSHSYLEELTCFYCCACAVFGACSAALWCQRLRCPLPLPPHHHRIWCSLLHHPPRRVSGSLASDGAMTVRVHTPLKGKEETRPHDFLQFFGSSLPQVRIPPSLLLLLWKNPDWRSRNKMASKSYKKTNWCV